MNDSSDDLEILRSVWEGHEDEEYRRDQSHWRGSGRWDDGAWRAIGDATLKHLDRAALLSGQEAVSLRRGQRAVEWGPGGGTNLYALRTVCHEYFGVDISDSNLAEAKRMIDGEGFDGFRPILLETDPQLVTRIVGTDSVDLIVSTAVFQHFPSKSYGVEVLQVLGAVAKRRALGVIQIRFDNGNDKYKGDIPISEYREKHIYANSYRLDEFWRHCEDAGFRPLAIVNVNSNNNYATFLMQKR